MSGFYAPRRSPDTLAEGLPARRSPWSPLPSQFPGVHRPHVERQFSKMPDDDDLPSNSDIRHDVWQMYNEQASKWREDFIEKWNKEMKSLLLFATLFSAVITAFVVLSYPSLRPDPGLTTVNLLQQVVASLNANQTLQSVQASASLVSDSSTTFVPEAYAIRVNTFWFASLVVSVSVAFLTILARQWLASLDGDLHPSAEGRGRQFQYRYDNTRAWSLGSALECLPLLLHMSLLLFFAGLIDFLWATNSTVAIVATVLIGLTVAIYIGTYVLSHLSSTCPYRTSVDPTTWTWEFLRRSIYTSWKITYPLVKFYRTILRVFSWCGVDIPPALAYPARGPILRTEYIMRAYAAPLVDSQSREVNYIFENTDLMDSRVLSRMVASFQAGLDDHDAELLAHAIVRFPHLIANRDLFIDAGTVRFLTLWLRWLEEFDYAELTKPVQKEFALVERALARLLTEVIEPEDDSRATLSLWGPPRTYKRPQETMSLNADLALRTLKLSNLDESGEGKNPDDIILFAHRLRLQLVAFPLDWSAGPVKASVQEFYGRLSAFQKLNDAELKSKDNDSELNRSEDNMSLVNTAIYVATRVIDPQKWTKPTDVVSDRIEHKHCALDALAALVLNNPGLDFALVRQICWALCVLSIPERRLIPKFNDFHLLITQVRSTDKLLDPLKRNVLAPAKQDAVMLHAVLAVFEELLYSTSSARLPASAPTSDSDALDDRENADRTQLLTALIARYPTFLQDLRVELEQSWTFPTEQSPTASWQHGSFSLHDSLRLLQRVVRISGFLGYYCPADLGTLKIDREQITRTTLEILQFMCNVDNASQDQIAVHRVAYGAACRFTILNCGVETPIVPPADEFIFDKYSARDAAEQIVEALRNASAVFEPPESVKKVLAMMADLRYISSHSRFRAEILAYLRTPKLDMPELLDLLVEKRCGVEAREAIDTLNGNGGLERPRITPPRQMPRTRRATRPRVDATKAGIRLK
ncbi:uncharacterized protein C8Q71DRAFT_281135 [Rhodofomes roseus]|uniref:DUF6535 domain-containing protein n=1 Tax=Rhodofomes roseus TaxID=34475 RepID=A0ABQ8K589_9APHY|nr:uncharacterized protein C8Q71DRAFT_281135 [Rhodofomes roseus]KAH9832087.1 hypothetical protein C8Q71DRAFT_281135 [Rhodofomes roseus]